MKIPSSRLGLVALIALVSLGQTARAQVFAANPFPTVQYPGTTAHFSASTNAGFAAAGVYWQVNNSGTWINLANGLQASGSTVAGALTTNLTVSNISVADAGSYQLVFTNATTLSNTAPVTLSLLAPPATNSFAAVALSYDPVAFWPLNEYATNPASGGVLAYDVAGGFTGTYQANALNGYNGIAGPEAPAYAGFPANNSALGAASASSANGVITWSTPTFEGPNATPAVTGAGAVNGTNVTFVAWIYPTETEPQYATWMWIRSGDYGAKRTDGFRSQGTSGVVDAVTYCWNNNSATTYAFAGPVFPTNTWSMVAVVVTPTNTTLYSFNTNNLVSSTVQTLAEDNEPWGCSATLGFDPSSTSRCWIGNMADILMYNSSLSTLQLYNLFAAGVGPSVPPATAIIGVPLPSEQYPGTTAHFGAQTNSFSVGGTVGVYWQANTNGTWVNLTNGLQTAGSTVSGAQTINLTVSNLSAANAGSYRMFYTNSATATNTPPVTLTILAPPATNSFAGVALSYNPVAFWPLNESSANPASGGVFAYDVAGGFTGTYLTNSQDGYDGVEGPEAPAFAGFPSNNFAYGASSSSASTGVVTWSTPTFEGPNATPPVTNAGAVNGTNVTFVAWIDPAGAEPQYASWLWMRSGVFGASRTDGFRAQGTSGIADSVTYTWNNNNTTTYAFAGPVFAINEWSMIAVVITPTNSTFYCFNSEGETNDVQTFAEDNEPWGASACIGNDTAESGRAFIGSIADVLLYNSSLSQNQIANLFAAGLAQGQVLPSITTPPMSSTLYTGRNAQLSVVAQGLGETLAYQWQVYTNGAWANVSGATSNVLSIDNVTVGSAASYQVIVSDFLGSVTSSPPATVTAIAPAMALPAYPQAVSNLNPVAYWRLNDASANAFDYWGGFTGTYGAVGQGLPGSGPDSPDYPGFETTNTGGSFSNIYYGSTATNSEIIVPPLNLDSDTVTITAWIYPTASPEAPSSAVFFNRQLDTAAGLDFLGATEDLGYTWANNSSTYNWDSGLSVPENQWSFVALVTTPDYAAVYVYNTNSQGLALNSVANPIQSFGGISWIGNDGGDPTGGREFNGDIGEVAVFNQSLSQDQLGSLFTAGSGVTPVVQPVIISPLASPLFANPGSSVSFTVFAIASSNATYAWSIDGLTLTNGNNGFAGGLFSGTTGATLTISSFTAAMAGQTIDVEVFDPNDTTPASASATLPAIISTPAIWTTDFCITNSGASGDSAGYQGVGVISSGTNWNCVNDEGPTDPAFNGGPWTNTTSFNDSGAFNTGVAVTLPLAGIETFSPPYKSLLLDVDAILPTNAVPDGIIVTAPPGFYNIVLFAIDGPSSHRGTIFTINGNSQLCENSDTSGAHNQDTGFYEGVNFVIYTNVEISTGALDIGTAPDPNADGLAGANTEAIFNGLQLQLIQPIGLDIKQSGANAVLSYSGGALLQAPTVRGPWTTNGAPSPASIPAASQAQFFKLQLGDGLPSD